MTGALRRLAGGRLPRLLLALLLLGAAAYQAGRVLQAERAIIDAAGGGGMALPLDDSFIYLQYARAIAEGRPFVYTPGNDATTGATSLWYPLLLVPPHLFGAGPAFAVAWTFGLGVLFYFLIALLAWRLAGALGGWPASLLACGLVLASPHVLWGSLSGMEIGFYAAILLATALAYVRERGDARFPTLRWWAIALAGARPEGAILCGVFGILALGDAWRAGARDGARRSPLPVAFAFAAAALPFIVNLAVSGTFESTSSQAKSILAEPYGETRTAYLLGLPALWLEIGKAYLSFLLPARLPEGGSAIPPSFGWIAGLGLACFVVLGRLARGRWPSTGSALALLVTGVAVGALPVHWWVHYHRYLQGLLPLLLVVAASGWGRLAGMLPARAPRWTAVAAGLLAAGIPGAIAVPKLLPEQRAMVQLYGHNCQNILHQQVAVGRWIDQNLPPDAVVGLNDAGAIAYFGRRTTVDLVGLTSAGYARVYRSGLGCLFEHLRRRPAGAIPTYFAVYPEWFPYWPESGIFGPEAFRARIGFNTICGGTDMVVYPASWLDAKPTDRPALAPETLEGRTLVDALDHAWLEDERRHEWRAEPEAKDVLRRYAYADRMNRPATDGGRILRGGERFRVAARPGRDLLVVMRTDAWYPSRLRVTVDGRDAGTWAIERSGNAWVEPRFTIPGRLVRRDRPEIGIRRDAASGEENAAPFRYWFFQ
ncbi:MAG TPA: hypothetical protein VFT32_02575 [Candidatus Eisenbacteria bacterium]|nr:hypothetical protein [Candidatus Eisenbacteria bacterium]